MGSAAGKGDCAVMTGAAVDSLATDSPVSRSEETKGHNCDPGVTGQCGCCPREQCEQLPVAAGQASRKVPSITRASKRLRRAAEVERNKRIR